MSEQKVVDEFDDEEFLNFAIENYSEMFEYIATGRVNIRIHRDGEDDMVGVGCNVYYISNCLFVLLK